MGPWLPEPLTSDDPADHVTLDESVSYALLVAVLDPDVVCTSDGGGRTFAARKPLRGVPRVARAWAALSRKFVDAPAEIKLNGRLGLMLPSGDGARTALTFVVSGGRITRIDAIRNPDKLRHL